MPAQTFTFKTVDGVDLAVDVYPTPATRSGVILSLHGGGMIAGSRADIAGEDGGGLMRDLLNEVGYTVVSPDYRLAPESKLADMVEDLSDAWNWLHTVLPQHLDVDAARAGVMGRSAGGYLSLLLGTLVQPRPAAIVSFYGYGSLLEDWVSLPSDHYRQQALITEEEIGGLIGDGPALASSPEHPRIPIYFHARQRGKWMSMVTGLDPKHDAQTLRALSPNHNIDAAFPATLLLHGSADTDVPYEASVSAEAALRAARRDVRLITIEGADHLFDRAVTRGELQASSPGPVAAAVLDAVAFFRKHLG